MTWPPQIQSRWYRRRWTSVDKRANECSASPSRHTFYRHWLLVSWLFSFDISQSLQNCRSSYRVVNKDTVHRLINTVCLPARNTFLPLFLFVFFSHFVILHTLFFDSLCPSVELSAGDDYRFVGGKLKFGTF